MSGQSLIAEVSVSTQKAEKDLQNFVNKVNKQLGKLEVNPKVKGTSGNGSSGGKGGWAEETKKQAEKAEKEFLKHLENVDKAEKKAAESLKRQRMKSNEQQIKDDEKFHKTRQKLAEDALQRFKLIEIQRGRFGEQATEHSRNVRLQFESEMSQIIARANQNNLEDTKRALALELAIHRKHLDEKVASEKRAAAQQLAAKNHAQKQASKFNNQMFQVQQLVEDASFAGFRGASNNLALMANQLGGPGGTIALFGLMAATMTPVIARLSGVGKEAETTADKIKKLNEELERSQEIKMKAGLVGTNPMTHGDVQGQMEDLGRRQRELRVKSQLANELENPAQTALDFRRFRERALQVQGAGAGVFDEGVGLQAFRNQAEQLGIDVGTAQKPRAIDQIISDSRRKQIEAEQALERLSEKDFSGARIKPGIFAPTTHDGTIKKDVLEKLAQERKQVIEKAKLDIRFEEQEIKKLKEAFQRLDQQTIDAFTRITEGRSSFGHIKLQEKFDPLEVRSQQNDEVRQHFEDMVRQKEEEMVRLREKAASDLRQAGDDPEKLAERTAFWDEKILEKDREINQELSKRKQLMDPLVKDEEDIVNELEKAKDLHEKITDEIEKATQAQKKKIEKLQQEKQINQDAFQLSKIQTQAGINQKKITEQGEDQMKKAEQMAKKFDPMINKLKFFSQSPVLGQMASQQLQMVEQAKASFLKNAQEKIQKHVEKKVEAENQKMFGMESQFLKDKATAAGQSGDFEEQQKQLEKLQQVQMQAASSSKSAKDSQKHLDAAAQTQEQIIQSIKAQEQTQKNNLNTLGQMKNKLDEISKVSLNENSLLTQSLEKAKQTNAELQKMQANIDAINNGKPMPHQDLAVPGQDKGLGKPVNPPVAGPPDAGQKVVGPPPQVKAVNKELEALKKKQEMLKVKSPEELMLDKRIKGMLGVNTRKFSPEKLEEFDQKFQKLLDERQQLHEGRAIERQGIENQIQQLQQQEVSQANTNTATIVNATINKAIIQDTNLTAGGGGGNTSNTNVTNNSSSIGSVNITMQNNRQLDFGRLMRQMQANSRIRMS